MNEVATANTNKIDNFDIKTNNVTKTQTKKNIVNQSKLLHEIFF